MAVRKFPEDTPAKEMIRHRRAWVDGPDFKVYNRAGQPLKIVLDVCDVSYDEYIIVPRCPCKAGQWERPCWHAAVALRRMQREKIGVAA